MKYYIIREDLATELGLVAYSRGTAERGYLVNNGDLATCDIDREEESGRLTEVTTSKAKEFIKDL